MVERRVIQLSNTSVNIQVAYFRTVSLIMRTVSSLHHTNSLSLASILNLLLMFVQQIIPPFCFNPAIPFSVCALDNQSFFFMLLFQDHTLH